MLAELRSYAQPDIAFLLDAGGRVLDGARLYVDVVEINPPLVIVLNAAAVWMRPGSGRLGDPRLPARFHGRPAGVALGYGGASSRPPASRRVAPSDPRSSDHLRALPPGWSGLRRAGAPGVGPARPPVSTADELAPGPACHTECAGHCPGTPGSDGYGAKATLRSGLAGDRGGAPSKPTGASSGDPAGVPRGRGLRGDVPAPDFPSDPGVSRPAHAPRHSLRAFSPRALSAAARGRVRVRFSPYSRCWRSPRFRPGPPSRAVGRVRAGDGRLPDRRSRAAEGSPLSLLSRVRPRHRGAGAGRGRRGHRGAQTCPSDLPLAGGRVLAATVMVACVRQALRAAGRADDPAERSSSGWWKWSGPGRRAQACSSCPITCSRPTR